jgi:hypothetical protein
MKSASALLIAAGLALAGFATRASADVLTFDNLSPGSVPIPANYGGFTWSSDFYSYDQADYNGYGNSVTFPSGTEAAFNAFGDMTVSLSSGTAFNFDGAYFTSWQGYGTPTITVTGYNGATLVGSDSMAITSSGFTWLGGELDNVTSLQFTGAGPHEWWLMDNFTYNQQSSAPDAASTLALFAVACLGVAGLRRKLGVFA